MREFFVKRAKRKRTSGEQVESTANNVDRWIGERTCKHEKNAGEKTCGIR